MLKSSIKERVVRYEENDIVCDLCESVVPEGSALITLKTSITESRGTRWDSHKTNIEICSVDCLIKNAPAAGLLLNTKIIPEARSAHSADKEVFTKSGGGGGGGSLTIAPSKFSSPTTYNQAYNSYNSYPGQK